MHNNLIEQQLGRFALGKARWAHSHSISLPLVGERQHARLVPHILR